MDIKTKTGVATTINRGDKVTAIAGAAREIYITATEPYAQGMKRRARVLAPVDVTLRRFNKINPTTLAPEYHDPVTVQAQVKTEKSGRWVSKGVYAPESQEVLYLNNANTSENFGVIRAIAQDSARGLMFPGLFSVQYIPVPTMTGGNAALMIEPTPTPGTPVDIDLQFIELTDQYTYGDGVKQKMGDAVIKFTRDQLTQAQIGANGSFFDITPLGGTAIRYQVWNASEGVKQEQTYHWCVYLKRVRK